MILLLSLMLKLPFVMKSLILFNPNFLQNDWGLFSAINFDNSVRNYIFLYPSPSIKIKIYCRTRFFIQLDFQIVLPPNNLDYFDKYDYYYILSLFLLDISLVGICIFFILYNDTRIIRTWFTIYLISIFHLWTFCDSELSRSIYFAIKFCAQSLDLRWFPICSLIELKIVESSLRVDFYPIATSRNFLNNILISGFVK